MQGSPFEHPTTSAFAAMHERAKTHRNFQDEATWPREDLVRLLPYNYIGLPLSEARARIDGERKNQDFEDPKRYEAELLLTEKMLAALKELERRGSTAI